MWILITLFALFLLATFGMLFRRAWQIERGLVEVPDERNERTIIPYMTIGTVKKNVVYYGRRGGHIFIMTVLHLWVLVSHAIAKQWKKRFPKKELEDGSSRSASQIAVFVTEYKNKAKKLRERVKRQDKQKEIVQKMDEVLESERMVDSEEK